MTQLVAVPDVLDETAASAQEKLEAVGLNLGAISTEKNPGGVPGTVLRTSPSVGALAPQGSTVDLVLIEAADALAVPNVVGLTQLVAAQQLSQAGLRVGNVFAEKFPPIWPGPPASQPKLGTVVRTTPSAGGQAAPNSGVDIVVAEEAELTVMPHFFGLVNGGNSPLDFLTTRGYGVEVRLKEGGEIDLLHMFYLIVDQSPQPGEAIGRPQPNVSTVHFLVV